MTPEQEPKYCIVNKNSNVDKRARIANRKTGEVIPDDEPIMIFRAKDIRTYQIIALYMELCRNPAHQRTIHARLRAFKRFQEDFSERVKEPD